MASISASAVAGNPTTPCGGCGCCEITQNAVGTVSIPVTVSSSGPDLTVFISDNSLSQLSALNAAMYTGIMNRNLVFDKTAMPFYIDASVSNVLWPGILPGPYNLLGSSLDTCMTYSTNMNNIPGYNIVFPNITKGYNASISSGPGMIAGPAAQTIGAWQIGTDFWGNLIFTNGQNLVMFGANGNVNVGRHNYTVAQRSNTILQPINSQASFSAGNWIFTTCQDQNNNTMACITNLTNTNALGVMGTGFWSIYFGGNVPNTGTMVHSLNDGAINNRTSLGSYNFWTDNAGNLFMTGGGFTISAGFQLAFGVTGGLYYGNGGGWGPVVTS